MDEVRPNILFVNRCFIFGDQGKLLFIKRATGDRYMPDSWEPPGGKLKQGEDVSRALENETFEETGLLISVIHRLVFVDSSVLTTPSVPKYVGWTYVVLFSVARMIGGRLRLSDEHSDAKWITFDEALQLELKPEIRKAMIALEDILRQEAKRPSG